MSACMLIPHKGHTDTIQVYSVTVMTHVKAVQAEHSIQGTSEPITPGQLCEMCQNHPFYFGIHGITSGDYIRGLHGEINSRNLSFIWK